MSEDSPEQPVGLPSAEAPAVGVKDWFWLEVLLLVGILVAGAGLRFLLSTTVPFDASEMAIMWDATTTDPALRMSFIMISGAALFAFYLLIRRSAGPEAAFAALLLLQTSLVFQEVAMRIRWATIAVFVIVLLLTIARFFFAPWRAPRKYARVLIVVSVALVLRWAWVGASLPERLDQIAQQSRADPELVLGSLKSCGANSETSLDTFRRCRTLKWPSSRSLEQQKAMLEHYRRVGDTIIPLTGPGLSKVPSGTRYRVLFDADAVAFFAVPEGPLLAVARQIILKDRP